MAQPRRPPRSPAPTARARGQALGRRRVTEDELRAKRAEVEALAKEKHYSPAWVERVLAAWTGAS